MTRAIPCLLLQGRRVVKTTRFRDPTYIGDPVNTCRLFNDKEVDELVVLDIEATATGRGPDFGLIAELASECFMPLGYGGGVRTLDQMHRLFSSGIEKVILNTAAIETPQLITDASARFGAQSIIAAIDVKKRWLRGYDVMTRNGRRGVGRAPAEVASELEGRGAGEILLTSVDRDGTMTGYDLELIKSVTTAVRIPVVASGGAASVNDLGRAVIEGGASAASAGSMFIFQGPHRAVLISYPSQETLQRTFAAVNS